MRMQDSQATCGPSALSNALAALGVKRSSAECEVLCKASATNGTNTKAMAKAIQSIDGTHLRVLRESRPDVAMLRLLALLQRGRPVLLVVDSSSHWVAAVGVLGDRVLVADAADLELVLSYTPEELATRWRDGKTFYGVGL